MQKSKPDLINIFKFEKQFNFFVSLCLSIILLAIIGLLVKVDMTTGLQQALTIILGLIAIATLDAFRKTLNSTPFALVDKFNQIIVQDGGLYINGGMGGDIYQAGKRERTLTEAAAEIQELLTQLETSNPTATEAEKVAYVNEETPSALKSRVASAAGAGGEAAIDIILSNTLYSNVARAIIQSWISQK